MFGSPLPHATRSATTASVPHALLALIAVDAITLVMAIDKRTLLDAAIAHVTKALATMTASAKATSDGATHEQSRQALALLA